MTPAGVSIFDGLADSLATFEVSGSPTPLEAAAVMQEAFELLEAAVAAGRRERDLRRELRVWLRKHCGWLPKNKRSLQRRIERDLVEWRTNGRRLSALLDKRPAANRARRKEPAQFEVDRLASVALHRHLRLDAAWRELQQESGALTTSRTPRFLRRVAAPLVESLRVWHDSPRKARINGAHLTIDWSEVCAGDIFSADDFTLEVYFYRPDGALTRGQFLMMLDARSKMILAGILIPERSYAAVDIRRLILRCADVYGLPRRHFLFENGIWRRSKLIGGEVVTGEGRRENFAQRLGIEIRHAQKGNPRGKAFVENTGKLLQARLRRLPGWCGPNEQLSAVESVQRAKLDVESGRKTATEAGFLSFENYVHELKREVDGYNEAVQESDVMGGDRTVRMSPRQAWEELQQRNVAGEVVPGVSLRGDMRYLIASHIERRKVTRNGIRIISSGVKYWFREGLADLVGREIGTYWDIEQPGTLTCETETGRIFTVAQERSVSAVAGREELAEAMRRKNAFNQRQQGRLLDILEVPVGKPRFVVATVHEIAKAREVKEQRESARRDGREADRISGRLGRHYDAAAVARIGPENLASLADIVSEVGSEGIA